MPTSSTRQIQNPNVVIQYLAIRNNSKGIIIGNTDTPIKTNTLVYVLVDQTASQNDVNLRTIDFHSLNFIEDMNEPHMSGNLIVVDSNNVFDQLGIDSGGEVEIRLTFYDTRRDGRSSESSTTNTITRFFNIIDVNTLNNPISQDVSRSSGSVNYVSIRFASKEAINTDFTVYTTKKPNSSVPTHFIGPISTEEAGTEGASSVVPGYGTDGPDIEIKPKSITGVQSKDEFGDTLYEITGTWDTTKHSSFFSQLIRAYNSENLFVGREKKKFWSDATENEIWLKPEYFYYPGSKPASIPSISQLINYIKNYAVLKDNPNVVDFMFWEDLSGFYFKSIKKAVQEEAERHNSVPRPVFYPDPNPNNIESIAYMEVISDVEPVSLFAQGALTSEYIRIKPNWRNPFRNILGTDDQFVKTLIKYDYKSDIGAPIIANAAWNFSSYPPFNINEILYTDKALDFNTNNFRSSEEIYGFYDTTTHNTKKTASWNFLDSNFMGFTYTFGKIDNDKDGSALSYKDNNQISGRLEEEFWQSQYDFCELSAAPLYVINKIKTELEENRKAYVNAKKTNDKWKFYLENICCERKVPSNFFALLVDAKKIYGGDGKKFKNDPGGIYAYDWIEVEFWPRTSAETLLREGEQIIKFENHEAFPFIFVKPKGGLHGHGSVARKYDPKTDPLIEGKPKNTSFNTKDTRAYNISELLNSAGLKFSQEQLNELSGDLKTAVENCKLILMSPGLSSPLDRAKIEDGTCKTSYPDGFSMLPAGGFRYIGDCNAADETKKYPLFFGRIVQMNVIPREIMQTIIKGEQGITAGEPDSTNPRGTSITVEGESSVSVAPTGKTQIPYLFLFDSVNAHDGLCDTTCTI